MTSRNANEIGRNCDFKKLIPQRFSIPSSFIYYMAKNPTSLPVYQKLIQSCKYFFAKNPIIVVFNIPVYKWDYKICEDRKPTSSNSEFRTQLSCIIFAIRESKICHQSFLASESLRGKMLFSNALYFGANNAVLHSWAN